jgi:hypothetical protein
MGQRWTGLRGNKRPQGNLGGNGVCSCLILAMASQVSVHMWKHVKLSILNVHFTDVDYISIKTPKRQDSVEILCLTLYRKKKFFLGSCIGKHLEK